MKRALRAKSVGTKVSEAELRVLESRAAAGLTLSEWVRDVLLASSVEMGTMAAERAILAPSSPVDSSRSLRISGVVNKVLRFL